MRRLTHDKIKPHAGVVDGEAQIWEGANQIQRLLVAKYVYADFEAGKACA